MTFKKVRIEDDWGKIHTFAGKLELTQDNASWVNIQYPDDTIEYNVAIFWLKKEQHVTEQGCDTRKVVSMVPHILVEQYGEEYKVPITESLMIEVIPQDTAAIPPNFRDVSKCCGNCDWGDMEDINGPNTCTHPNHPRTLEHEAFLCDHYKNE